MKDPYARARRMLRRNREAAKITYSAFAKLCGHSSASSACEWESGGRNPSFAAARIIESTLGTPTVEDWGYDRATGLRKDRAAIAALAATGTDGAR